MGGVDKRDVQCVSVCLCVCVGETHIHTHTDTHTHSITASCFYPKPLLTLCATVDGGLDDGEERGHDGIRAAHGLVKLVLGGCWDEEEEVHMLPFVGVSGDWGQG